MIILFIGSDWRATIQTSRSPSNLSEWLLNDTLRENVQHFLCSTQYTHLDLRILLQWRLLEERCLLVKIKMDMQLASIFHFQYKNLLETAHQYREYSFKNKGSAEKIATFSHLYIELMIIGLRRLASKSLACKSLWFCLPECMQIGTAPLLISERSQGNFSSLAERR